VAIRILEVGLEDTVVHRLLIAATLAGAPGTQSAYVRWRLPFVEYLERVVERGTADGLLRRVDPRLTARAFVGLVMDCVLCCDLWTDLGYDDYDRDALIANNVPTFVRGLLRSPDRAREPRPSPSPPPTEEEGR
jgi:hypothetical protein